MASVRLNGDTSGFIEISAPSVAGSTTITLPATSGGDFLVTDSNGDLNVDSGTLFVDASTNSVGIGTTSPATTFVVDKSDASGLSAHILVNNSESSSGLSLLGAGSSFSSGGWPALTDCGIIRSSANSSNGVAIQAPAGAISFWNSSEAARIDSSGRLLVGTTSASISDKFIVYGNANNNDEAFATLSRGSAPADGQNLGVLAFSQNIDRIGARILAQRDGGTWTGGSSHPGRLVFSTTADGASSPTERMRIRSNGQTYWGSSAPGAASFGTSIGRSGLAGFVESYRNVNGTFAAVQFGGTAGYAQVMGDGDLENTNNRYTGLSDAKFKQNIEDATSQWDDIKSIQVRKYELIANPDRSHIGCVAQELELVCPGLVIERENLDGETYKSVAYSVLYMKAVKALQEAMERIETLETANASLEARLTALEGGAS